MLDIIPNIVVAFIVTYYAIPIILLIAQKKRLYNIPEERSSHSVPTPSLGGIGIFTGFILSLLFFAPVIPSNSIHYLLGCFIIIYLLGIKDDLDPIPAKIKLLGQSFAAILLIVFTDIRLHNFYGFLGLSSDLPYWLSFLLTLITILVIMNAYNLIDGINGLSASLGTLALLSLGCWFYFTGYLMYASIAASAGGAYLAFLRYNLLPPTQIFMGDSGALMLGTIIAILTIQFIELNSMLPLNNPYKISAMPIIAISIIIVPLFDTLRVFIARIYNGSSPMVADRCHVHHLLIDYGFSHAKATGILFSLNLLVIIVVFIGQSFIEQHQLLLIAISLIALPVYLFDKTVRQKKKRSSPPPKKSDYYEPVPAEEHELEVY